jgi:hypothetical protein
MARTDTCAGCGTELSPGARYCVKCGRSQTAPVLDLERVEVSPVFERSVERAVAQQQGPRGSRRTLVALGALAVVIVGAVVVMSGGGATDNAASPTTTVEPTSTTRPRRPTTTVPSSIVGQIGRPLGGTSALLGAPTGERVVYVLADRDVARIELDTGVFKIVPDALRGTGNYTSALLVRDGSLVVGREGSAFVMPADLSEQPQRLDDLTLEGFDSSGRLLSIDYSQSGLGSYTVREFDPTGRILATWDLPSMSYVAGAAAHFLVLQAAGRIYLVDGFGSIEPFGVGEVIFASGSWILWRHCDDSLECTVSLHDLDTGSAGAFPALAEVQFFSQFGILLAPDGRTAVGSDGDGTLSLLDLETGEPIAELDGRVRPAWTPDGAWCFTRGQGGTLLAIPTRGGDPVEIDVPGLRLGAADIILAVG